MEGGHIRMQQKTQGDYAFTCGRWPLDPKQATLIFIHGNGQSSLLWHAQVEGLKHRVNTMALDLPGHGRSRGTGRRTVEDYAAAVIDFITAVAAPSPIPCGLSLGGAITQQLLLDHPARIRGGVIINSGARLRVLPSLFELIEAGMPAYVEAIGRLGFSEKTPPSVKRPLLEDCLNARPEVVHGDFQACDGFDVMQRLSGIRAPVLVISAEDDQLTPVKYGEFLEKHIPNAVRAHLLDAGHFAPIEKPSEVNAAITRFLEANKL
jgi:pimeloyl-ACP methyl ester carboxylesterase